MFNREMTYGEMCKALGEEAKVGGRNKALHIERLKEQYDIQKARRGKYIIRGKYSADEAELVAIEKNYNNFIQAAILDLIANGDIKQVYTYSDFRKHLCMVNENYFLYRYGGLDLDIKVPGDFPDELLYDFEDKWFDIAEAHDKYVLKSNLNKLREKGIIDYTERYSLWRSPDIGGDRIYTRPHLSTDEEWALIEQAKIDFMVSVGARSVQEVYKMGRDTVSRYYQAINDKVKELGYDGYSKAFVIIRPYELKRTLGFIAPKFNQYQVDRLLKSKRFGVIPSSIHQQMIDKTIKIKEG